jgi:uncharacterized protein
LEIEKNVTLPGTPQQLWLLLLNPQVMGECVPGMKSIEVISPIEYLAKMEVKISFLTAKFKIKTVISEQEEPKYLKSQGTGEDSSIASSFKQTTCIWISDTTRDSQNPQCALRMLVDVTMLGRIGSFGLSAMKTKADLMWEEFILKLRAQPLPVMVLPEVVQLDTPAQE